MKKIFAILMAMLMALLPVVAVAEAPATESTADVIAEAAAPLTWEYLATVGGCAAIVFVIVQMTKEWLDKWIKIPTAWYAYVLAVVTMLLATAFTVGLTASNAVMALFQGWIVAATAGKAYDVAKSK